MKRYENWPELLDVAISKYSKEKFAWGSNDCILFACSVIAAITGIDPAASFRDSYISMAGARETVLAAGHATLQSLVCALAEVNGMREIHPNHAGRGDMVSFDNGSTKRILACTFGIVGHDGVNAVFVSHSGLLLKPTAACSRAWRV